MKPLLFCTLSYAALRDKMLASGEFEAGVLIRNATKDGEPQEEHPFKDGEHYMRLATEVEGRECVVVGGTINDTETIDLIDIGNALFDWGAAKVKFVVPFLGYSTMERAVKHGEAVKAKYRMRMLSAIPQVPGGNRFYFLDLHVGGLEHYLENRQSCHVYAKPVILKAARDIAAGRPFVFASTDAGRMKWIESLARDLGVPPAFAYKHRDGDKVESLGVSGPVAGQLVIIYDDMIRTGGSLLEAAKAYKAAGAAEIAVIATHGILPGDALTKLKESGLVTKVVVTDSLPRPEQLVADAGDFLKVETVAPLLVASATGKNKPE